MMLSHSACMSALPSCPALARPQRPAGPHPVARESLVCRAQTASLSTTAQQISSAPQAGTPVVQPQLDSDSALSGHPDAVRRRQEAVARRHAARREAQTARTVSWWEGAMPANMMQVSTADELQGVLEMHREAKRLVVVNFFAPWCQACKALYPKLKQLAEQHCDVVYVKVNAGDEALHMWAEQLGVSRLPWFYFYREGQCLGGFACNLLKVSYLRAQISRSKAADALEECSVAS